MVVTLSCIAALAPDADRQGQYLIGSEGDMPWHFPADLRWFRKQTMGKPILMGRKTFESIGSKPLPGRENLVVSRTVPAVEQAAGVRFFSDMEEAVRVGKDIAARTPERELMVIGGGEIYARLLPLADRLYITWIEQQYRGDTHFPPLQSEHWELIGSSEESDGGMSLKFCRYQRAI